MKIYLFDNKVELCNQWEKDFQCMQNVTVLNKSFIDLPAIECVISPANSFGLMDGGLDLVLREYFGDIQKRVQESILLNYGGIQPVGSCIIVKTGHKKHPYLAHTPTMLFPQPIINTINVFLAFKSTLEECERQNMTEIACPGLGSGVGQLHPIIVSKQMLKAVNYVNKSFNSWEFVSDMINDVVYK